MNISLVITLLAGIIGGTTVGLVQKHSLGWVPNILSGIVGGSLGTWILQALLLLRDPVSTGTETGINLNHMDPTLLTLMGVSALLGGAALTGLLGLIKRYADKNPPPQV